MKSTKIQCKKVIIKPNCRKVHGIYGALQVALRLIKKAYEDTIILDCNKDADYEVTLTVIREDK